MNPHGYNRGNLDEYLFADKIQIMSLLPKGRQKDTPKYRGLENQDGNEDQIENQGLTQRLETVDEQRRFGGDNQVCSLYAAMTMVNIHFGPCLQVRNDCVNATNKTRAVEAKLYTTESIYSSKTY